METFDIAATVETAEMVLAEAEALIVTSQEDLDIATEMLNEITRLAKQVDQERAMAKAPHLDAGRRVDDLYRGPLSMLEQAKAGLKADISAYTRRMEEARRAEEARLAEIARAERLELASMAAIAQEEGLPEVAALWRAEEAAVVNPVVPSRVQLDGVALREEWHFEVEDAALLPASYLMPNEQAIRAAVRTLRGNLRIPGVRIWSERVPVSTGRWER